MWVTTQRQLITDEANPESDDDTSLYRLFGFSLFVSIRFRKRVWFGRLQKRYTYERRRALKREYNILVSLVESDKSVLPACIKFQDRGKMTFPHHSFLPFARACSKAIKTYLNDTAYKHHGRHVVQVHVYMYMHKSICAGTTYMCICTIQHTALHTLMVSGAYEPLKHMLLMLYMLSTCQCTCTECPINYYRLPKRQCSTMMNYYSSS